MDVEVFEMPIYIFNSNVDCGFGMDITRAVVYWAGTIVSKEHSTTNDPIPSPGQPERTTVRSSNEINPTVSITDLEEGGYICSKLQDRRGN